MPVFLFSHKYLRFSTTIDVYYALLTRLLSIGNETKMDVQLLPLTQELNSNPAAGDNKVMLDLYLTESVLNQTFTR